MEELLSPKQAAKAIGVSESSLKRWCDQGLIETEKTIGGHRKLRISDVIRFIRERDHPVANPEILGLPSLNRHLVTNFEKSGELLAQALLDGNEGLARQIIFEYYLARGSISAIFDDVVCKAFVEIGCRWKDESAHVYQERRSCEILQRSLFEIRRTQLEPDPNWIACGGTFEGDGYSLPTKMVELVLRDAGWNAVSLGSSIPAESMIQAISETKSKLFWVCASHISDVEKFVVDFQSLWKAAQANQTALVIGGRAFDESLRQRLTYCCYCDTMKQLEAFARSMRSLSGIQPA